MDPEIVDQLLSRSAIQDLQIEVDLKQQTVKTLAGNNYNFNYDSFRKHCLLNGLDDIDYILSESEAVKAYRDSQADKRFFSTIAHD